MMVVPIIRPGFCRILKLLVIGQLFMPGIMLAQACKDGKDNDGDKLIDALTYVTNNKVSYVVNGNENPFSFLGIINQKAPGYGDPKLGGLQGHAVSRDYYSARRICNYYGYKDVKSTDCSSPQYQNRCNFSSPGNNRLYKWDGNQGKWLSTTASGKQWLAKIVCINKAAQCDDNYDNDGDGRIDLKDSGCVSKTDDSELQHDPGCSSPNDSSETGSTYQCDDGKDNDQDGKIDLKDPGCSSPTDKTETTSTYQCDDGKDNDQDGRIDAKDPGCSSPTDKTETTSTYQCDDGKDNDRDGKIDMRDPGCSGPTDNSEDSDRVVKTACNDGVDNDNDGLVDGSDPGCSSPSDNDEKGNTACDNGIDDDTDGFIDLEDPGCSSPLDGDETNGSSVQPECNDQSDNDGDGRVDLDDPGCSSANDISELGNNQCDNNIDDDNDGYVDLADPDCNQDPAGTDEGSQNTTKECDDGLDNDNDGKTDLADPDCVSVDDDSEASDVTAGDRVQPLHECNLQTHDGAYIAFFSAINETSNTVVIPVGSSAAGENKFIEPVGGDEDQGQATEFPSGYADGLFSTVIWPQDRFTWYLRYQSTRGDAVSAAKDSTRCNDLTPVLNCVESIGGGLYKAHFGYKNASYFGMPVPVGPYNGFTGSQEDLGQPTRFESGSHSSAFSVEFDGEPLTWTLVNSSVTASSASNSCAGFRIQRVCTGECGSCLNIDNTDSKAKLSKAVRKLAKKMSALNFDQDIIGHFKSDALGLIKEIKNESLSCEQSAGCQAEDQAEILDNVRALFTEVAKRATSVSEGLVRKQSGSLSRKEIAAIVKQVDVAIAIIDGVPRLQYNCK